MKLSPIHQSPTRFLTVTICNLLTSLEVVCPHRATETCGVGDGNTTCKRFCHIIWRIKWTRRIGRRELEWTGSGIEKGKERCQDLREEIRSPGPPWETITRLEMQSGCQTGVTKCADYWPRSTPDLIPGFPNRKILPILDAQTVPFWCILCSQVGMRSTAAYARRRPVFSIACRTKPWHSSIRNTQASAI